MPNPRIRLISHTPNIDLIAGASARGCLSEKSAAELLEGEGEEKLLKSLKAAVGRGHYSVLEHNRILWLIENTEEHEIFRHFGRHKFFEISKIGENTWVLSANLRSLLEASKIDKSELMNELVKSAQKISRIFAELTG